LAEEPNLEGIAADGAGASPDPVQPYVRAEPKLGRNEPCYCGSGKKYKHCHGKIVS